MMIPNANKERLIFPIMPFKHFGDISLINKGANETSAPAQMP